MAELTSRQIGKYQIQAELGRGGFGSVYRAYDPTVGRLVAVKVLTASGDQNLLTRFKNEAAAAGNLRHKNIVTIYDFGEYENLPYIVMEFLEGEDLQQIISQNKPLTLLQKVSIMLQVADGLHCAHRSGVVHRDVKPANIRLLPDGTVKIMDFGIARLVAGGGGGARLTRQGYVIGTLLYMAPEQVHGGEVDFLCDIFAYGITYYELLTGRHPFEGSDPRTVFYRITTEDPEPVRNIVPECPEALEAILNRTLHKERELRYQSLREVQLDTEPLLIELRQERASTLLGEANRLYNGGQLEGAQAVLNEAFDLDPGNREARQLRETIQSKLLRRVIEPKVEALLKQAEAQLTEREFLEAIASYEAALRLDRDNAEIKDRLNRARELLDISRESARKVADARREFSRNNLDGALQMLPETLELDPGNPEVRKLFQEVQQELERREREKRSEKKVQQARELLQANRFDDALHELDSLEETIKRREDISKLIDQVKEKKQAHERQQKFREELAAARELLVTEQYEAAIRRLELLMNRYPEEPDATKLFIVAHKKLAAQRKAEALQDLGTKLGRLMEEHQFDRALELVNAALREYPAEKRLLDAIREIEAGRQKHEHEKAVREALETAQACSAEGSPEAAVQVLNAAIARSPGEERLIKALADARLLVEQKQRDQAINALCRNAEAQLERREFDDALSAIDQGLAAHGQDPRLAGTRERIVLAKAQWERDETIRGALQDSERFVAANEPEQAMDMLERALRRYPGEQALSAAMSRARHALQAKRREQAIVALSHKAGAQLASGDFESALISLEQGLAELGQDSRLAALREDALAARAAWERSEAVRAALDDSGQSLARNDPDGAVAVLEAACGRYPDESRLSEALATARTAADDKRRSDAIEQVCREADTRLSNGKFDEALAVVERGLGSFADEARLERLRDQIVSAKAEQAIQAVLKQVTADAGNQQFYRALAAVDQAIEGFGEDERLIDLRDRVAHARGEWEREQYVRKALHESGRHLESGDPAGAVGVLEEALQRYPQEERLRQRVVTARDEWRRTETVRKALEESNHLLSKGDPGAAVEALEAALAQYSGELKLQNAAVAARRALETSRRENAIEAARQQALSQQQRREFDQAIAGLDQAIEANGPDERLTALRDRIAAAKGAWQREKSIHRAVAESKRRLAQGDPEGAVQAAEAALGQYPGDESLLSAAASAKEALEAKRRAAVIETVCLSATAAYERREFDMALDEIARAIAEYGSDQRLVELQQKTVEATGLQRREAIRAVLHDCEQSLAKGDPEAVLQLLDKALQQYPGEAQLLTAVAHAQQALEAKNRAALIQKTTRRVRQLLKSRQFDQALAAVDQELRTYPDDPELKELRNQVEAAAEGWVREQNVRQALAYAAELHGKNRIADALQVLRQALDKYPGEPRLATAYQEIEGDFQRHQREESLRATLEEVPRLMEHDPDRARQMLETALAERPGEPRLTAALENAKQLSDAKRRDESINAVCRETRLFLQSGEFAPALQTIEKGVLEFGSEQRLAQMRETVLVSKADFERAQGIRQAVEDASRYCAQGQPETAFESLLSATKIFGPENRLTEALVETKVALERKHRQEEIERLCRMVEAEADAQRLDEAARLLQEAEQSRGPAPELEALRRRLNAAIAERERAEAVNHAIEEINGLMAQDALDRAVQVAETALARHPGERRLMAVCSGAVQAREAKHKNKAIERVCDEIRTILSRMEFKAALKKINQAQKTHGDDRRFHQLRAEAAAAQAAAKRSGAPVPAAVARPHGPGPAAAAPAPDATRSPWILRVAAALVLIAAVAGMLWFNGYRRAPKTVHLQVRVSPANATVKVENQSCAKGDCDFDLKPGVYQLQISADGYESRTEEARLTLERRAPGITVDLKPLNPRLQLAANFIQGQVSLDGRTSGSLQEGQYVLDSLQPGKHELRISGSEGSATLAFEAEFARLPVLGRISGDGVDAVALGSFGDRAAVACSGCSGTVSVDDRPAGEIKNGVATISALSAGTHRLRLNTDSGERSVVFVAGGAPAVNLALASNRNYGTLVVDTGEDDVSVFIDGQRSPRRTVRGQFRAPVEAKEHTLRVAKDGFRAEPAEFQATVAKGGQLEVRFRLTPEPARLLVRDGAPGTTVSIDGRIAGTIAPDGSFSAEVPPGNHQIAFAREGFAPSDVPRVFSAGRAVELSRAEVQLRPLPQSQALPKAPPPKAPSMEPPRPDPAAVELADWQRAVRNPAVADVQEFLQKHPGGTHAAEAQRLLEKLEWEATSRNNRTALQAFLTKYPNGTFAPQATADLARIDREAAAEVQKQKEAEGIRQQREQVRAVLRSVSEAYARKDVNQIVALWPGLPATALRDLRQAFRDFESVKQEFRPLGEPAINGTSAVVQCTRLVDAVDRNGSHPNQSTVTVRLQNRNGRWFIDSIQ